MNTPEKKTRRKFKLLVSTDSLDRLVFQINSYYFSSGYTVNDQGQVLNGRGETKENMFWEHKKGRYRLLRIEK